MQKVFLKFIFLLFGLTLINEYCEAKRVPGFILTENADTLYGEIIVYKFDRITGGWIFNGINLEYFHFEVSFKAYNNNRFQTFKPEDILGFGFTYKSIDYIFCRFIIESKSIMKNERKRYRFLNLIYNGKVSLYKDLIRVNSPTYDLTKCGSYLYYDYYLFDNLVGLKKVQIINDNKFLFDILNLYDFEKDYLDRIPVKANFKDIKMILEEYDSWRAKKSLIKE